MSRISLLRVFKTILMLFIDISTPLLKCFLKKCSCLFCYAIPKVSLFHFQSPVLSLQVHLQFTIALDE